MALDTLGALIERLASRGDAPAVIGHRPHQPEVWAANQLAARARGLAHGLAAEGMRAGEVIGLLAPNQPNWIAAFLGVVGAGAIAMPLGEHLTEDELARILPHSRCRRLLTTARHARTIAALEGAPQLDVILLDEAEVDQLPEGLATRPLAGLLRDAPEPLPELRPDQVAALLYTSGTTGTPKGVPLTHRNLGGNVEALIAAQLAGSDDRVLLPLPLHHTYPLTVGVLAPLAIGTTIVLPAGITGPQIMRALRECRCTIMIAVPRLYEAMLAGIEQRIAGAPRPIGGAFRALLALSIRVRRRFGRRIGKLLFAPLHRRIAPDLRLLASGGARLDPEVAWKLEGLGWEVLTGYGLTETAPILTFNPPGRARLESVGLPVEGVELRIAPDEGAEPGQGEIQVKGPNVFEGYFDNPEATAEAFTQDGFFRTGDLGLIDQNGYLHIVGRSKELIVLSGGKNIFPDEVETVYGAADQVREVAVLEQDGRLVGLFVPEPEALRGGSADALRQHFRAEVERLSPRLPSYARIGDFAITRQPLPRTQIGKLRRHELPEIFAQEKSGEGRPQPSPTATAADRELIETPPGDRLWPWLNERFAGQSLTLGTSPQLDLGLDSFDWMSLTMELEERFGVRLTEDALARIGSLRDLLEEARQASELAPEGEPGRLSPEQERWLEPQGPAVRALAAVLFALNRLIMRLVFRVRVEGLEHIPEGGRYLLAPNHASYLDPFAIGAVLPWSRQQRLYWAGWTGLLFRGPLTRLFSRAARVVPVDPERGLTSTLAVGRAVLERDLALVWFPEGQRSRDGRLMRFLPGVGWLLDKTDATVVPAYIAGAHEAWPTERRLPRPHPITVRLGRPIPASELPGDGSDAERHARIAEALRAKVLELAPDGQLPPPA